MRNKNLIALFVLLVIAVSAAVAAARFYYKPLPAPEDSTKPLPLVEYPTKDDLIRVTSILPNQEISSPLIVEGEARGNWYFEASFPVEVRDANNNVIGTWHAEAQSDWMTTEYVSFRAQITFSQPKTPTGFLILRKDNPSGLPEHDDDLTIPITFKSSPTANVPMMAQFGTKIVYTLDMSADRGALENDCRGRDGTFNACGSSCAPDAQICTTVCAYTCDLKSSGTTKVKIYFGNSQFNPNAADCKLVYPVERSIPETAGMARAALEELLGGPTPSERDAGYYSALNTGIRIQSLVIGNGSAKADFDARLEEGVGGACRVEAIRSQIIKTLKQFPTINDVIISINGRTEDILQP